MGWGNTEQDCRLNAPVWFKSVLQALVCLSRDMLPSACLFWACIHVPKQAPISIGNSYLAPPPLPKFGWSGQKAAHWETTPQAWLCALHTLPDICLKAKLEIHPNRKHWGVTNEVQRDWMQGQFQTVTVERVVSRSCQCEIITSVLSQSLNAHIHNLSVGSKKTQF